jgi:hypothetical protein
MLGILTVTRQGTQKDQGVRGRTKSFLHATTREIAVKMASHEF